MRDMLDHDAERKEGQICRVLDCNAVLKNFQPGQWRLLEPKSP